MELERRIQRRWTGVLLFPIALFPLLSLLTYNWRDISWLQAPPLTPPSNLIGIVGAWSVFIGYSLVGLALWLVPVLVLLFSVMLIYGRIVRLVRRAFWMLLFLVALCCLLQLGSAAVFDPVLERLNLKPNAGGAVGYALMTCLLARWFSPVGGGILMLSIMLCSLFLAVGLRNLVTGLGWITGWWAARPRVADGPDHPDAAAKEDSEAADGLTRRERERQQRQAIREAARRAKEEARRAREEERQREPAPAVPVPVPRAEPAPAAVPAERTAARPAPAHEKPAPAAAAQPAPAAPPPAVYALPSVKLLNPIPKGSADHGNITETSDILVDTLGQFNVPVEVVGTTPGPVVTQYELRPAPNIKVERIASLTANLQMALEATSLRVQAPIPGKNAVGIEIPNRRARAVTFREIIEGEAWTRNACEVPLLLGKNVAGDDVVFDLTKAPHLLVAGATGSGKSVCLNAILTGLLMSRTPDQLRLILVDPKRVEFTCYNELPHLLVPVINDPKKVAFGLRWAIMEMEKRYRLLQKEGCRNIVAYNSRVIAKQEDLFGGTDALPAPASASEEVPDRLPYIVIVVDEVADIMAAVGKEVEPAIARLTSLSRAVGIHLILATQRPSVDVITGTIKSNIPGRIAFKVSQSNDSRTILDSPGAEELIGKGDMLFLREGGQQTRVQGAWVSDEEIARVVAYLKEQSAPCYDAALSGKLEKIRENEPEAALSDEEEGGDGSEEGAEDGESDDALLPNAIEVIRMTRRASTTMLQRRLRIGYTRAARLIDILEERGVVGPHAGSNSREILIDLDTEIPVGGGAECAGAPLPDEEAEADEPPRV
jgi:S-DNA-T family DNA segregation ATPase FtsK/SpoIIIE